MAARAVGVCVGLIFVAMAFVPKLAAVLVAIPRPGLQRYASSVRHYQYHDTDVVVVRVESAQA